MTLRWNPRMMWILLCLNIALTAFALGRLVEQYALDPLLDRLAGSLRECRQQSGLRAKGVTLDELIDGAPQPATAKYGHLRPVTDTSATIDGKPLWRWTP